MRETNKKSADFSPGSPEKQSIWKLLLPIAAIMGQICSTGDEPPRPGAFVAGTVTSPSTASAPPPPPGADDYYHHQQQQQQQQGGAGSTPSSLPPESAHSSGGGGNIQPDQASASAADMEERLARYRRDQADLARRESIVDAASRSMVPVSSSPSHTHHNNNDRRQNNHQNQQQQRGLVSTYYDPAYAAAAAQDILRSAAATGGMTLDASDAATRDAWEVRPMGTMPSLSPPPSSSSLATSSLATGCGKGAAMNMLSGGRWEGIRLVAGPGPSYLGRSSGGGGIGGEGDRLGYYLDDLAESFLEGMVPTGTALFGGCPPIVENLP